MFNEMLAESVAKATYWVLIIFSVGITLRFLIRDIIDFMLEDKDKKPPEEE
jgi:TRAP-type C4-dicarboxylate transport system permease small subunit